MDLLQIVTRKLHAMRRRLGLIFLAWGGAVWLAAFVALLLLSYLLDTFLHLPVAIRAVNNVLGIGILLFIALRYIIYPLTRKPTTEELALVVEREFPMLNDRLISSLQMAKDRQHYGNFASRSLVDASIEDGLETASRLNFLEALRTTSVAYVTVVALGLISLLGAILYTSPETAEIWRNRLLLSSQEYPSRFAVEVAVATPEARRVVVHSRAGLQEYDVNYAEWRGEALRVAIGSPLVIEASVHESGVDGVPDADEIPTPTIHVINRFTGIPEESDMLEVYDDANQLIAGRFFFVIKNVSRGLDEVFIEAGDGRSQSIKIEAIEEPSVNDIQVEVELPDYIPASHPLRDNSQLAPGFRATSDTVVNITCHVDEKMADGYPKIWFKDNDGARLPNPDANARGLASMSATANGFSGRFDVRYDYAAYEIILKTVDGIMNTDRPSHRVEIVKDSKAQSALFSHGPGLKSPFEIPVVYDAKIPLVYLMRDDIGISRRELAFVPPLQSEDAPSREWVPLARFSESYATRDAALMTILTLGEKGNANLTAADWAEIADAIRSVQEVNLYTMVPTTWSTGTAQAAGISQASAYEEFKAAARDYQGRRFESFMVATERYWAAATTNAVDSYRLAIADLMNKSDYSSREAIERGFAMRSSLPIKLRMRMAAFDASPNTERSFDESDEVVFLVGPRQYVSNEISSQISSNVFRTLSALQRTQTTLHDEIETILEAHASPTPLSEEEMETIRSARARTSYLRRDLEQIVERLDLIAQTYIINDLSNRYMADGTAKLDNNVVTQEKSIAKVRLVLGLMIAPSERIYGIDDARSGFETYVPEDNDAASNEALMKALETAFNFNSSDRTLGRRADPAEIGAFFNQQRVEAATYARLLAAFENFTEMGEESTLVDVFTKLNTVHDMQKELLQGFAAMDGLLKKWRDFDRIREALEELQRAQKDILKDLDKSIR